MSEIVRTAIRIRVIELSWRESTRGLLAAMDLDLLDTKAWSAWASGGAARRRKAPRTLAVLGAGKG